MSNSSIWPIDRTLSGATTLGQSGPGSNGKYSAFPIAPRLELHHHIIWCHIQDTLWWFLNLLQRCSQCILLPQLTGLLSGWRMYYNLVTIVKGNPKAPFLKATTPRCRGGCYPFPGLLHFILDLYLIMLSVKKGGIKYHFLSLWYNSTWDWTRVSQAIGKHSNHSANVQLGWLLVGLVWFLCLMAYQPLLVI